MKNEIYIVGAGTYGEAMCELALTLGYAVKGFYDEDEKKRKKIIMGYPIIGKYSELNEKDICNNNYIVAIGNNEIRYNIMKNIENYGGLLPNLFHPTAVISPTAKIGKGVYIQANAYIWTNVEIGNYCIISPNVVIAHHSNIGNACLISTLSGVGASITVRDKVFIGMGSTIVTGMDYIGENSIIGAGAVVLKNVEENTVYAGVPARRVR